MKQAHLFISGFVQGVGYRQFIKRAAEQHSVAGWVQNLPDGRVEAVLQGLKKDIEKMILLCRKGPFLAEVEDVEVSWEEKTEDYIEFMILSNE